MNNEALVIIGCHRDPVYLLKRDRRLLALVALVWIKFKHVVV